MEIFSHEKKTMIIAYPFTPVASSYSTHVYSGLSELSHENKFVNLRFLPVSKKLSLIFKDFALDPKHFGRAAYIEIFQRNLRPIRIFFDLADASYLIAPTALSFCDFYFKRGYDVDDKKRYEYNYSNKVFPYGLFYTVMSDFEKEKIWRNFCCIFHRQWLLTNPMVAIKTIFRSFSHQNIAKISDFITSPEVPAKNKVMYQIRLFHTPSEKHYHYDINKKRIEFFRALKKELGNHLVGGIADSKEAQQMAPDLIARKSDINGYIDIIRNSLICVSTEGLAGTNPDKIPTFLSMSRCIVSQRLNHIIPEPLADRKNIYFFNDTEDCIRICKHLLANPDEVQRARNAAHEYFQKYASPKETLRRCLLQALNM